MPKMNQEIKEQWVKALRSGKYRQTDGVLCQVEADGTESFCCLGVLFDVAGGEVDGEWEEVQYAGSVHYNARIAEKSSFGFLPEKFKQFVKIPSKTQIRLTELNDTHAKDFNEIADWIEKHL